jgi:hypothetical protein
MNPPQLTDEQCLIIWTCCFDPDLREGVPPELVPEFICTCLEPGASHPGNIDDLENMALKLWEQDEVDLAVQLQNLARKRRALN